MNTENGVCANTDGVHIHLENKKVGSFFFWFIWLTYALVYLTKYCFSSSLASIVEAGVMTKSQTGLIAASFHFVYAPLQILGGVFADRYNPEKMIKIGLFSSAVANILIFLNHNYYFMLCAWMFNAVAQFVIWPSVFKIIASQLPRSERKKNVFYMSFSATFGLLLSYIIAAILPSWEYNFAVSAIILFSLFIAIHFIYKKVDSFMLPDKVDNSKTVSAKGNTSLSNSTFLWKSGLIFLVIAGFIRTVIGQGSKTLAPTMLMESYNNISASLGNALNVIIIISGILGTFAVRYLLYPKIIKNEVKGIILLMLLILPFTIIIKMIGVVSPLTIIISMCCISFFSTAATLYVSYYNSHFAAFGKDGLVAGISNGASSVAIIAQTYGLNVIADNFGWSTVSTLWVVMVVLALVLLLITLPLYNKFRKTHNIN